MISIIVSTCNRKSLTGITLDSIMSCKANDTQVHVIDDCSTEYDNDWFDQFGVDTVVSGHSKIGCGAVAKERILRGTGQSNFFILLDNDALVTPGFDVKSLMAYQILRKNIFSPLIFSPYRSATHEAYNEDHIYDRMKDIGGISLAMDRLTAKHLLSTVKEWDNKWDYRICEDSILYAPRESWIQHIGRYGDGVNGESNDKALNFIGWKK